MKNLRFRIQLCLLAVFLPLAALRAQVGNNNPTGPTGDFNGDVTTACSYDPYTGNAKRTITDIVVAGAVGQYGLSYSRTWNTRNNYSSWLGTFDWSIDSCEWVPIGANTVLTYTVRFPDGRTATWSGTANGAMAVNPPGIRERFQKPGGGTTFCYLLLPDGGKIKFLAEQIMEYQDPESPPSQWRCSWIFTVQAIIDPYGQTTTYTYNADGSTTITEPAGRWIKIFYTTINWVWLVDYIQASDGRFVDYNYGTGPGGYTVLTSVGYYGNVSSPYNYQYTATYTYDVANVGGGSPVLKTCDDPMYAGPMKKIGYVYKTGNSTDGTPAVYGQILSENYYDGSTIGVALTTLEILTATTRKETRADGKTRTFTYNTSGYLTSATDFKGVAQTQAYDGMQFVNAVTDRRGNTTNFTNTSVAGALTQVQYPLTPADTPPGTPRGTVTYAYTDTGNPYYLYSVTDEGGNLTRFTRDTSKRVTRIDYPDTGYETFTYNSFGQVLTHVMKTGGTESWEYDAAGKLTKYRDAYHQTGNPSAWFQYDALGRVSGITDALGSGLGDVNHTTTFTYNSRGQTLTTTSPPDGYGQTAKTVTNIYNPDGTLVSTTDQLGAAPGDALHTTSYTYDDYRRVRSLTSPQRSAGDNTPRVTSFSYDSNQGTGNDYTHTDSNVTRLTLPSTNIVTAHYDENYRKDWVQASAANGTTDAAKTSYEYDNAGNLTFVRAPNQQPSGPKTAYTYDESNRLMSVVDALNHPPTTFLYDAAGRKKTVTRANGQVIAYDTYDAMNRLLQQTVKQTPNPDAVTKYTYFTSGLLNTMQDPKLVADASTYKYIYAYDLMGRKTSLTYPPDASSIQRTEAWHYDMAGRIDTFTNRDNKIQTLVYDALNRQKSFTWNDGLTPGVTFAYDAANRLTSVANANSTISRAYFNDNLLQSETQTPAGQPARTIGYTYNADGNRATVQYPDGYSFTYGYSGRDQLKTVSNTSPASAIATYGYDPNGNVASRLINPNATNSSFQYNALNQVTNITHNFVSDTLGPRTFAYDYDSVGNRKWAKRQTGTGEVFGYDLNDQVTAAKLNVSNPDATPIGSQTVYCDANGNRTSFAAFDPTDPRTGTTDTYSTTNNRLNQYGSRTNTGNQTNASYDTKGNLTAFGASISYQYDAQNRMISATNAGNTITFKYDGLNRQVSRKLNANADIYSVWDGWNLIEEIQSGSVTAAYLNGATGLVKNLLSGNYYYQDGSGSTSHLASSTGQLLEWYRYDLHGTPRFYNALNTQLSATNYGVRHLFTGQQWSSELGLYDLRNRFYSPDLGRFLQPDPIGFGGDRGNLYRYCGNNSVTRFDPLGLTTPHKKTDKESGGASDSPTGFEYHPDPVQEAFNDWLEQQYANQAANSGPSVAGPVGTGSWGSSGSAGGTGGNLGGNSGGIGITGIGFGGGSLGGHSAGGERGGSSGSGNGSHSQGGLLDAAHITLTIESLTFHGVERGAESWLVGAEQMAARARIAGGLFFVAETGVAIASVYNNPSPQNFAEQTVNTAFGASAFTPLGPAPAVIYFGVKETVGWGTVYHGVYDGPSPTWFNGHPMVRGSIVNPLDIR